jgi:glycosyltransferase involved in cell wall biosynthesis
MHILQIVPHYLPGVRFGGPLRVAHSLARALIQHGHQVVVCTTNLADENTNLDVEIDKPVNLDGVTVYYEPTIFSRYWGFSPLLYQRAAREIAKADIIFIHAHYQFANWIGARVARRASKAYIIFTHGSLHKEGIRHGNKLKFLYIKLLEGKNLHNALFLVFNAQEEKESSLYSSLGKVVPNGIDPMEFAELPQVGQFRQQYPQLENKLFFLFLGRLDIKQKGLDFLLKAFAKLAQERQDIQLVIAGPDEDGGSRAIRRLAQECNIEDRVILTGLLKGQEKLAVLQDADAFVLPSRFEGLSIALLEALYMGLPVLVTDQVGLHKEINAANAGLVIPAELDAVYEGLKRLADTDVRNEMRGKGTDLVLKRYTWDAIAEELMAQVAEEMPELNT